MDGQVTAFFEERIIARGSREAVTRVVEEGWPLSQVRVFDDETGRVVDLDIWDARKAAARQAFSCGTPRARGRPKLGVTAREVTLLPRHWEWLGHQPGGASAAIRRLVEAARKEGRSPEAARDAVYRFLPDVGGDRPNYEEAMRALYRGDIGRLRALVADWPEDVRRYAEELLGEKR
jgi:uncharacterized protein